MHWLNDGVDATGAVRREVQAHPDVLSEVGLGPNGRMYVITDQHATVVEKGQYFGIQDGVPWVSDEEPTE